MVYACHVGKIQPEVAVLSRGSTALRVERRKQFELYGYKGRPSSFIVTSAGLFPFIYVFTDVKEGLL